MKIDCDIVGDYKYGDLFHNRVFENEFDCKNLFLHAYSLQYSHPITLEIINLIAPFPNDWIKVLKIFDLGFYLKKPFSIFKLSA
ncbi:MAG: hypothetical protein JJE44_08865 [Flavobacteriaceae bacterium]|nr:hypothetical protein [Flavobacteriaceae bacterium]